MLKLTMNPRKRSKRNRAIPHRLRLPSTSSSCSNNNNNNAMDVDESDKEDELKVMIVDNLQAMLKQEHSGKYTCTDYLSMAAWQQNVYQPMSKEEYDSVPSRDTAVLAAAAAAATTTTTTPNTRIDEYCREQIVEWSFRVVDYFRIDREVVAVSLSFLDRFLANCRCDRSSFKLAATTTLHLAVKLLYPCKLAELGILSDLSRGEFDMKDVAEMETHILRSVSWNLHPPSSIAFATLFLDYLFLSREVKLSVADLDDIYDVSSFFSELAVCDYFFVSIKASTVALASVLNALEGMFGPSNSLSREVLLVAQELHLGPHQDLSAARNRLWELYERSEECALHNDKIPEEDGNKIHHQAVWHGGIFVKKLSTLSPVSVSKPCHSATDFVPRATSHAQPLRNESW